MAHALGYLVFTGYPVERTVLTILVVIACALPFGTPLARMAKAVAQFLGRRAVVSLCLVFAVSLLVTSSLSLRRGLPVPYVHDEFSYLLAADTFAHGRLTNPTPPLPEHFESMHILVRPSYMSKYPPGQGLVMALGQRLFGHPIWGVWCSVALAAAATCWALRAFVPGRWALLGGLLMALHPQILEWGQRYWGGGVAVLGGALLIGGVGRLMRRPTAMAAFWAAAGVLILANSRPYEGLALTIITAASLLLWLWRRERIGATMRVAIIPTLLVLIPGVTWMGYYNWRVTGSALRLPYREHQNQYGSAALFLWEKMPSPKTYGNPELQRFAQDQAYLPSIRNNWRSIRAGMIDYVHGLVLASFGNVSVLAIPLIVLPWAFLRNRRVRLLTVVLILFTAALLAEVFMYGHYAAPAAALMAAIVVMCLRRVHRLGRPLGPLVVRVVLGVFVAWSAFWWMGFAGWKQEKGSKPGEIAFQVRRDRIERQILPALGPKHLVLVRYAPDHNVHEEWVYNLSDLDRSAVVWARELDHESTQRLLERFKDRQAWLVEPDKPMQGPVPYVLP